MQVTDKSYIYPPKPLYVPPNSEVFNRLDGDTNWVAEVKKNGWRMLIRKDVAGDFALWTRHKTIECSPLPLLRAALPSLNMPCDSILDAELMEHRGKTKEVLMIWGAFRLGGVWQHKVPYKEIMWKVSSIVPKQSLTLTSPEFVFEKKRDFYERIIKLEENEGLVLKNVNEPVPFSFTSCPNIRTWIKVKPNQ